MSPGPLRQLMGAAGLVALAPTAALLAQGALNPASAAIRALVTLATVMVVGRLIAWWLGTTARGFERRADGAAEASAARRADNHTRVAAGRRSTDSSPTPDSA